MGNMVELVLHFESVSFLSRPYSLLDHEVIDFHQHFYGTVVKIEKYI